MILSAHKATLLVLISLVVFTSPKNISAECIEGNCVNGQGTYIWPNGDKFAGEWKNGKRNGHGSFIWPEGDRYTGEWKNDRNNGQGNYTYPQTGIQYFVESTTIELNKFGCIKGDCVNGRGTYSWHSGAKYVGDFVNGKRNGLGIYAFPNGQRILGVWENGRYAGKTKPKVSNWEAIAQAK